jgi:hypothetical protein
MAACKASLVGARRLDVDVHVTDPHERSVKHTKPPAGLPELFADVVAQMGNLERLDWGISSEETRDFQPAFAARSLMLTNVKYLMPGAGSEYLVSHCPNV